jgi:hypothetical protein
VEGNFILITDTEQHSGHHSLLPSFLLLASFSFIRISNLSFNPSFSISFLFFSLFLMSSSICRRRQYLVRPRSRFAFILVLMTF